MKEVMKVIRAEAAGESGVPPKAKVYRPQPREAPVKVNRLGDEFIVTAPGLERIKGGAGVSTADLRWELNYQFKRLGVDKALEKAGVKEGDKVRCGEFSWEWSATGRGE
jgi:Obg family GTPase CgtA-like protein